MKEALLKIYQERMNKCTSEQFWAVALVGTVHAFILLHRENLAVLPRWLALAGISVLTAAAMVFVYSRHRIYRFYDAKAIELLRTEDLGWELPHPKWGGWSKAAAIYSGVTFYSILLLGTGLATMWIFIRTR